MIFKPYYYYETGCAAYLLGCGSLGKAAVVDAHEEDVDAYIAFAASKGMRITHVIDTHIHADHRSGGHALARKSGATYCLHASADVALPFEALSDGQEIELGNTRIKVLHTPGHTPESISLVVTDLRRGVEPWFVLTGDTLFVGAVGRPDLPGRARENASELYDSIHSKLLPLPAELELYPAHFAGSACGAGMSGKPSSSLAFEKRWNPLLSKTREEFIDALCDVPPKPPAMEEMLRVNQGASANAMAELRLGLRENLVQFALLVVVNAFVGGMIGMERTILPSIAEQDFQLAAKSAVLSFIVVFGITKALTNYLAGRLSDRFGRKHVLVAGWLVAAPVPFLLMWAPSWFWILAANALLGVSQGLTWSTTVIMKIDLVGPQKRGLAMGLNEFAGYIAVAASALVTGLIAASYGLRPEPFYLGVAFVALGLLLSVVAVRETRHHVAAESKLVGELPIDQVLTARQVFARTSFQDRNLSSISQAGLVNNLNDGMAWGLFPLFFQAAHLSLDRIGTLAALYPATWGMAQLVTGAWSDRIGRKWLIAWGMWIQGGGIMIVVLSSGFSGFAVGAVLLGLGTAMVYPTLLAAIGDVAHPSWRASSVGVYRLWRDLGYAIGALLAGFTADALGLPAALWIVAAITFGSGVIVAVRMRETLARLAARAQSSSLM